MSTVSTDPTTLLGYGAWQAIATGRILIGVDPANPRWDAGGKTSGTETIALTAQQMPAHTHVQDAHGHTQDAHTHTQNTFAPRIVNSGTAGTVGVQGASTASNANASNSATTATNQTAVATNQTTVATNQSAGGGTSHDNVPPVLAVYIWQRTA